MLDFSRFTEAFADLIGGAAGAAGDSGGPLADLIASAEIDPAMLDGLSASEIIDLLAQNGIDVAQLAPDQIQEVLAQLGVEQSISALAVQLLESRFGGG